jgi:hypothetical protein
MAKSLCFFLICLTTFVAIAMPKITVIKQRTVKGFAQVQVVNNTMEQLLCHVAIDGHKVKFRLMPLQPSQWYTASDKRFNHTNFSVWCDYLELHPAYQKKK